MTEQPLGPDTLLTLPEAAIYVGAEIGDLEAAAADGILLLEQTLRRGRRDVVVRVSELDTWRRGLGTLEGELEPPRAEAPLLDEVTDTPGIDPHASSPGAAHPQDPAVPPAASATGDEAGAEDREPRSRESAEARTNGDSDLPEALVTELVAIRQRLEASEQERRAQAAALLMTNRRLLELAGPGPVGPQRRGPGPLEALGLGFGLIVVGVLWVQLDRQRSTFEDTLGRVVSEGEARLAASQQEQGRALADLSSRFEENREALRLARAASDNLEQDLAETRAQSEQRLEALAEEHDRARAQSLAAAQEAEERHALELEALRSSLLAETSDALLRAESEHSGALTRMQSELSEEAATALSDLRSRAEEREEQLRREIAQLRQSQGEIAAALAGAEARAEARDREVLQLSDMIEGERARRQQAQDRLRREEEAMAAERVRWGAWTVKCTARAFIAASARGRRPRTGDAPAERD